MQCIMGNAMVNALNTAVYLGWIQSELGFGAHDGIIRDSFTITFTLLKERILQNLLTQ